MVAGVLTITANREQAIAGSIIGGYCRSRCNTMTKDTAEASVPHGNVAKGLKTSKRRAWTLALCALLFGLTFGAPLYGGVSSLFWETAADGNDARRVADSVYRQMGFDPAFYAVEQYAAGSLECRVALNSVHGSGELLDSAIDDYRNWALRGKYAVPALNALADLPRPTLGALHACMAGSALSPFCRGYAISIVKRATAATEATRTIWAAKVEDEVAQARCFASRAVPQQH